MKSLRLSAHVSASGALELEQPLPEQFRSTDVEIVVLEPAPAAAHEGWKRLALESFFEDDDERDALYDSL